MIVIAHYEVPSGAPTLVEFNSGGVWADYTDLVIQTSVRTTYDRSGTGYLDLQVKFNDSASGYSARHLVGNSSTTYSVGNSNVALLNLYTVNDTATTANTFSNGTLYLPNINSSNTKSASLDGIFENNSSTAEYANQYISAGLWSGTDPITKLSFLMQMAGTNYGFAQGSSFTIYGVLAGSDGTTTVS